MKRKRIYGGEINLLKETLDFVGDLEDDVKFVANGNAKMSWSDFKTIASKIDYDNGYGCNEIDLGLVVVGTDWWLERYEYDGSENWEFKRIPKEPKNSNEKMKIICPNCIKHFE